jgi:hypothetical protein
MGIYTLVILFSLCEILHNKKAESNEIFNNKKDNGRSWAVSESTQYL